MIISQRTVEYMYLLFPCVLPISVYRLDTGIRMNESLYLSCILVVNGAQFKSLTCSILALRACKTRQTDACVGGYPTIEALSTVITGGTTTWQGCMGTMGEKIKS